MAQNRRGEGYIEQLRSGRAESRRRYALARPWSRCLAGLAIGRDVGFAKSGFRPTALAVVFH